MSEHVLVPAFRQGVIIQLQDKVESLSNDIAYIETVLKTAKNKRIHDIVIKNFKKRKEKQFQEFVQFYTKYSKFLLNKKYPVDPSSLRFQQTEQANETPVSDTCSTCSTDVSTVTEQKEKEKEKERILVDMYDKKEKLIDVLRLLEADDNDFLGNKESLKILNELSTTLKRITSYVADTENIPTVDVRRFPKKTCDILKGKKKVSTSTNTELDDKIINYLNNPDASFPGMEGFIESSSSITNSERQYSNDTDINNRNIYTKELSFRVMNLLKNNTSAMKESKIKNNLLPADSKSEKEENDLEGVKKNSILLSIENSTLDSNSSRKSNLFINKDVTEGNLTDMKTEGKCMWCLKKGKDISKEYTPDGNKSVHFDLRENTDDTHCNNSKKDKDCSFKKFDLQKKDPEKEDPKKEDPKKEDPKEEDPKKEDLEKEDMKKGELTKEELKKGVLEANSKSSNKKGVNNEKRKTSSSTSNSATNSSSYTSSSSVSSSDSSYSSASYGSSGYGTGRDKNRKSFGKRKHIIKINKYGKGIIFHAEKKGFSPNYLNDFEIIYDNSNNEYPKIGEGSTDSSSNKNKTILKLRFLQRGKKIKFIKHLIIREDAQIKNLRYYNSDKKWMLPQKVKTDIYGGDNNHNNNYNSSYSIVDKKSYFQNGNNITDYGKLVKELSDIINNITENKMRYISSDKCVIETVETNRLRGIYLQLFERQRELETEKNFYKNELDVLNKNLDKFIKAANDDNKKVNELNSQRSELLYKTLEEKFTTVINAQLGVSQEMNAKEKHFLTREKELEKNIIELQCELRINKEQLAKEQAENEKLKMAYDADRIALANAEKDFADNQNYKEEIKAMHQKCEELEKSLEIEREEKKQLNYEVTSQLNTIHMLNDELKTIKEDTTFDNFRKSVLMKVNNTNSEIQILADRIKTLTEELEIKKNKEKTLIGLFAKSKKENASTKKDLKFSKEKLKHKDSLINSMQQEIDYLNVKIENLLDSVKFLKRENEKYTSRNNLMKKITV